MSAVDGSYDRPGSPWFWFLQFRRIVCTVIQDEDHADRKLSKEREEKLGQTWMEEESEVTVGRQCGKRCGQHSRRTHRFVLFFFLLLFRFH